MKKIFSILAIAALMVGCSKDENGSISTTYTLTGYSSAESRTAFGEIDDNKIPFVWSAGDKIWSGTQQSNEAVINGDGSASFTFASEPESPIYYNMRGASAKQAYVPASQSIENNLGENGDFGYAEVVDGTFTLNHATAYLWFNTTTTIDNATLKTITINADGVNIAGKATWSSSSFVAVSEGKSEVALTVNQTLSSTNGNVWAMVVLPANLSDKSVKVIYELTVGSVTKYYTQTLTGKQLPAGTTQKISANISEAQLTDYRELRVLTFEDSDKKFSPYNIDGYEINTWSDLIVGKDEQAYMESPLIYGSEYWWEDTDNTGLYHKFPYVYDTYAIMGGGYAISSHTGTLDDLSAASDIYEYQLSIPCTSGHSGKNFAVGFHDSAVEYNETILPSLEFKDKIARVVDHMWVTNTSVTLYSMTYGNFVADAYKEGDFLNIVATGYNGATKTGEVRFELAKDADKKITEWTKWDLSSLGKVTKIIFRMEENTEGLTYGTWYDTPMYFAFDDVAVQF